MKKIKIPGDTIIVPMFIGCFINTFIPQILQIGGFTTPIVKGAGPLVGAFLFVIGGTISLKNTPKAVVRGASIIIAKIIVSIILGLLVAKVFNDNFLGLSAVAVIGAISVANNAMYAGIVEVYGDEIDAGACWSNGNNGGVKYRRVGKYFYLELDWNDFTTNHWDYFRKCFSLYEESSLKWNYSDYYRRRILFRGKYELWTNS